MRLLSSVYVKLPLTVRDRKLGVKMVGSDILKSSASHCYYCESLEQEAAFRTMQPDLLVSVGSSKIFKRSTLELPRIGTINIHNAQIPKYRGHFGTFWEAYHRENWGYICIHEVVQKVDAGRIIALDRVKISDFSSFLDLLIEKKRRGGILLAQTIREIQDQGSLLEAEVTPDDTEVAEGYYGWPSFSDLLKFRESSPNE